MKMFQGSSGHYSKTILFTVGFFCLALYLTTGSGVLWAKPSAQDFLMDCYLGTTEEVKKGIEAGADVNAISAQGSTPLMAAILGKRDSLKKVKMILAAKADTNIKAGYYSWTALDHAISNSNYNLDLIKLLLEADFKINDVDLNILQSTPLIRACFITKDWPDKDAALLLNEFIKQGVDVNQKSKNGATALVVCAAHAGPKSLDVLLKAGAEVDAVVPHLGSTALMGAAAYNAHPESIILLLNYGANPNKRNKRMKTTLEMAQGNNTVGAPYIQAIIRNPENRNQWKTSEPPTIDDLVLVSYLGTAKELKRIIKGDTKVNIISKQGETPLSAAIKSKVDSLEKVNLLLAAKANSNLKNKYGDTPLHLAISNNTNLEIVKRLLEAKADINAVDKSGTTPFIVAAGSAYSNSNLINKGWPAEQHAKLLKLMLEYNPETSYQHQNNQEVFRGYGDVGNALIVAAGRSSPESLKILIETGINVNDIASPSGLSALLIAAEHNTYPESISLLLKSGADPNYVCPKKNCDVLNLTDRYVELVRPERIATGRIKEILREAINESDK